MIDEMPIDNIIKKYEKCFCNDELQKCLVELRVEILNQLNNKFMKECGFKN